MKFRKGDKVCALLVCNKWGVDLTCFIGTLSKISNAGSSKQATIEVTRYVDLVSTQKHKPRPFVLDLKLWQLLHWNLNTKEKLKQLRATSRSLNKITSDIRRIS